jgi:hypothetical protein
VLGDATTGATGTVELWAMIKEKESKCMGMQHNSERARRSDLS